MLHATKVPDTETLTLGLSVVLASSGNSPLTVIDRRMHGRASTFPLEIVSCRLNGGEIFEVVCKYSSGRDNSCHGHRGGVQYEGDVYRQLMARSSACVPRFLGVYQTPDSQWTWLVMEHLDKAVISGEMKDGLVLAGQWLGRFHAAYEGRGGELQGLRVYDAAYYRGWAERTREFTRPYARVLPWLPELCHHFQEIVPALLERPATMIHGEFYSKNVLIQDGVVFPVDWEAAAVASGELDLASVIEKWPTEMAERCKRAYEQARWPGGPPADFETVLEMARLYWLFRWLGDTKRRTEKRLAKRVRLLRSAARHWGLL
jgi:hypothetical protein